MSVERILARRALGRQETERNGIGYFSGKGSLYPTDGSYLDPESMYRYRFQDMCGWVLEKMGGRGMLGDIGGGTGNLEYHMAEVAPDMEMVHLDYSFDALVYSKTNHAHPRLQADASLFPFSSGKFDGIVFADILEHLSPAHAQRALEEALRVLRPDGHLFVNIPNRRTWSKKAFDEPSHLWIPSIGDIRKILQETGFNQIETSTRGFPFVSKLRPRLNRDPHLPIGGLSIFAHARK